MKYKQLVTLLIAIVIITSISLRPSAYAAGEEHECFHLESYGLLVEIRATTLAWPGENISITIRAKATQANIHIHSINMNISSTTENQNDTLLESFEILKDVHLKLGDFNETSRLIFIPLETLPGLLSGKINYSWSIEGDAIHEFEEDKSFTATYVLNKPYEDLRQHYEALNDLYSDLQANYTSLDVNYTDLQEKYQQLAGNQIAQNNATGLMYLFLITTAIFVATTILLLIKRPKTTTW